MDLPYPTQKNPNLHNELNQLDKLARSILLSTHDIPKQDSISKNLRNKILRAITCDNARKLHQILEKNVVGFGVEIGARGSRWNVLHFCAKNNAYQCTQYILKTQFQEFQEQYKTLLNSKTVQGYTPLIITIINRSHKVMQKLLEYGGIDIHVLDQHKTSAYEIAINYKNDRAIRQLMSYQSKTKKKQYLNTELLNNPINFPSQTACQKIMGCLLACVTFGVYQHGDGGLREEEEEERGKVEDFVVEEDCIDYVAINSKKDLRGYDIEWRRVSELMVGKVALFDSYNPFQILQPNFTIKHNLILFQCLTQQPWLLRRCLKPTKCHQNSYTVHLYPNRMLQKQTIDDYIPYIKDRKQAMFLCSQQEMWPMLLQKALGKLYGSYFAIAGVGPRQVLEEVCGFPTVQVELAGIKDEDIISYFQQISAKNYLYFLKAKQNSDLTQHPNTPQIFTILNFYQKNSQQLLLINCPFISQKWKQKQRQQPLALKLIKGHYNTHKQMCVWVESRRIRELFQSVVVALTWTGYQRAELRIRTREFVFFRFRVENKREENIYFQLSNTKTQQIHNLSTVQIIQNQGKTLFTPSPSQCHKYDPNLACLQCIPGQYMCSYQIDPCETTQPLLLLCWSIETIQPEFVEPELGVLEWLGFLRNHFVGEQDEECVLEVIGGVSLVALREKDKEKEKEKEKERIVLFRMSIEAENIIQGKKDVESGFVEMVPEGNVYYCVVRRVIKPDEIIFDYRKRQY